MADTSIAPILLDGEWQSGQHTGTLEAHAPATGKALGSYPVSDWSDLDRMLDAADDAFEQLQGCPVDAIASFIERFADRIESRATELCETAHEETALPVVPRLRDVELPRTVDQLRQAAEEARSRRWTQPTLSPKARIASMLRPLPGAVAVFGPNNFPFAFNSVAGGDAAAALATAHPVIAKAHPLHPATSRLLAEEARAAVEDVSGIPPGTIQFFYHTASEHGLRIVADPRVAASAFTGSRKGGLALKASADAAGKPIYLEMSSTNPIVVLPGAVEERGDEIADELAGSVSMGSGQFCTKPGLVFAVDSEPSGFRRQLQSAVENTSCGALLGEDILTTAQQHVREMERLGARVIGQGTCESDGGAALPATLMTVSGKEWLSNAGAMQTEVFGPITMLVDCGHVDELHACLEWLEGNLTGGIYSAFDGRDDAVYPPTEQKLARNVGRLLNDKPPTGVTVASAMNHGGPYPATRHPRFTAVGLPASMERFGKLQSFDNVRDERLPHELRADNPLGIQRFVETEWTDLPVVWGEG